MQTINKTIKIEINTWKNFFSRRFTSLRFSWGFFSLFMSVGTFSIVLSDRITTISLPIAFIASTVMLIVLSLFLDKTGIRQNVNGTESNSNPRMMELMQDVKEIKNKMGLK